MTSHINQVKVNSAELKTHLGRYLRTVEQDLTTFEVRVRDRTVAYLIPAKSPGQPTGSPTNPALLELGAVGIKIDSTLPLRQEGSLPGPVLAGDRREDVVTTDEMRKERDW